MWIKRHIFTVSPRKQSRYVHMNSDRNSCVREFEGKGETLKNFSPPHTWTITEKLQKKVKKREFLKLFDHLTSSSEYTGALTA